jgi:phage terminase large subunit-like protein
VRNFRDIHAKRIHEVTSGIVPAGTPEKLAIARCVRDHEREQSDPSWPYRFDMERAIKPCRFISRLKFVSDSIVTKSGEPFVLRDDQIWHLMEIFGWVNKETGDRRFRRAFLMTPRGNGKTTEESGLCLFMVSKETGGAQILCAASMKDQARYVLDPAREMALQDKQLCKIFNLEVTANTIRQLHTGNIFKSLSATATSIEGSAPNFFCLDELHAARGRRLHDAADSGMAKKRNSLFICITTAGDRNDGVANEKFDHTLAVLKQEATDESFFGVIHTCDESVRWDTEEAWRQANPGYGISVDPVALESEANRAKQVPGLRAVFRSRHLNQWIINDDRRPFMDAMKIARCYVADLKEQEGADAEVAGDTASTEDLTACVIAQPFVKNDQLWVNAFCKCWLPQTTFEETDNALYQKCVETGELVLTTRSATTDYSKIEEHILEAFFRLNVRHVSFDPSQASYLMTRLTEATASPDLLVAVAQNAKNMTSGMRLLQELVADGRLRTNSSLLIWALKNLRMEIHGSTLMQPRRPVERSQKIDPAIALVMCLSRIAATPPDLSYILPPKTPIKVGN